MMRQTDQGGRKMSSFIADYKELKDLISENPTLPLIFMASEDCGGGDYSWTIAQARASKGIYLEAPEIDEEKIYSDEDDLREDIIENMEDGEFEGLSEDEFEALIESKMAEYSDKWIDVIYVYVDAY